MESAKCTSYDLCMPSIYPKKMYSLYPLAKPSPLPGPGEESWQAACHSVSYLFLVVSCRQCACIFEGTLHSRLEQPSFSYRRDVVFFFLSFCSVELWLSEWKISLSCFLKCCCCIGTVTVELRERNGFLFCFASMPIFESLWNAKTRTPLLVCLFVFIFCKISIWKIFILAKSFLYMSVSL